jgi:hypothetical protein
MHFMIVLFKKLSLPEKIQIKDKKLIKINIKVLHQ